MIGWLILGLFAVGASFFCGMIAGRVGMEMQARLASEQRRSAEEAFRLTREMLEEMTKALRETKA